MWKREEKKKNKEEDEQGIDQRRWRRKKKREKKNLFFKNKFIDFYFKIYNFYLNLRIFIDWRRDFVCEERGF